MSGRMALPLVLLALFAVPAFASITPAPGSYAGHAPHHGPYPVSFRLTGGKVADWVMDNRLRMPDAVVNDREHWFSVTQGHNHLEGHWTSDHTVVGVFIEERPRAGNRGTVTVLIDWIAHLQPS